MELESKFFKSFFYPFLLGVILSTLIVTIFIGFFTNSSYNKRINQYMINLESKFAKNNLKTVNIIITSILLKIQAGINEQILLYQRIANKIKDVDDITKLTLQEKNFKNVFDLTDEYLKEKEDKLDYWGYWYISDEFKTFDDIKDINTKKQIIAYSNIIHNLYSILNSMSKINSIFEYFFFLEETDLFLSFPVSYDYYSDFLGTFQKYYPNPFWCTNEDGEIYNLYHVKCRDFYINIQKARSEIFDNNYINEKNKTIFITNFYRQLDEENNDFIYTVCIQFFDPISKGKGYVCCDVSQKNEILTFDSFNANLLGYFFIASVGFNNVFFFPQENESPKTTTENIYKWSIDFFLDEKNNFFQGMQKILTSNYINQLNPEIYSEIFVNGQNSSGQNFNIKNKKYKYALYPVILENLNGEKEHVLSIIYIYNDDLFLSKFFSDSSSIVIQIILEIAIFIIFGWGLLYIIYLTFNTLVKHIVIPIKNVNYMLKGINIGGKYRLDYLDYLKKRQDDNLEKLEKMYLLENYNNNNDDNNNNVLNEEGLTDVISDNDYNIIENNEQDGNKNIIDTDINNKSKINDDYNKTYDEESNYIEKENNFYDFDEALLQFRPLEIENLVKLLIDIKRALQLTSYDQSVMKIIDYSYSKDIFRNFKNKEGTSICQSNIGNLQIQLLKYDKAIYHLANSLQDNKLKKYLSRSLNDELDEKDSLLNKISNSFKKEKIKEKNNILMQKQQNNMNDNFSQKNLGILINTRYCRLIHSYYKFFKGMKKLQKINNDDDINGQFMNTYFHNINYYHKILIQYIYLSFVKKDLIKIGESILDYIEFLIKFKLKTSSEKKNILKIQYKDLKEYREKQKHKKKTFDKIIKWFNLFDDYIIYLKDNTSFGDDKNIINDYSHNIIGSDNSELNSGSQSALLFKVNIQRSEYLKGKFALICKNYNDALYYFIRSAKKKSIVIDGLIKKKSLKNIFKLLLKMKKKYKKYGIIHKTFNEKMLIDTIKKRFGRKKSLNLIIDNNDLKGNKTFNEEIKIINDDIIKDISECNAKEAKDVIILIDFNIYTKSENNEINMDKLDAFISQTKVILNDYLSSNDRFAIFIYINQYHIICPLMYKYQLDLKSFSKDLNYYKTKISEEMLETDEYDINLEDFHNNKNIDLELDKNNYSEYSQEEESLEHINKKEIIFNKIEGLIATLNYIKNYIKMKEGVKNEKYVILFTDIFNSNSLHDEKFKKIIKKLKKNKEVIFLLVGKNKNKKLGQENNNDISNNEVTEEEDIMNKIRNKFGEGSEIIFFENMIKIKTILPFNNVIKDEIIYPNEIYN